MNSCASITTSRFGDKGSRAAIDKTERNDMSDSQLTSIARLEERLDALKERL
jgi:hypothetical protein